MRVLAFAILVLLAGCAENSAPSSAASTNDCADGSVCEIPEGASISGVVVDQAIVPIEGATISLPGLDEETTSAADGRFYFEDLEPGAYAISTSHPFYDTVQTVVTVENGEVATAKIQLTRIVFDEPYTSQAQVDGYLACSSNTGGLIAEECGEGAGVPCAVPVVGCQRAGGLPENQPEARFYVDGPNVKTIQAEVVWEPTVVVGSGVQEGGFTAIMATNFVCDPVCRYDNSLDDKVGHSPLIMRTDDGDQGGSYFTAPDVALADAGITAELPISVFVWTSDDDVAAVTFDQPFTVYVTASYALPLPEGWTLVNDGSPPF